jgi:hypothetical protein
MLVSMTDEKVEVLLHTQEDGTRVIALVLSNMPIGMKEGQAVTGVALTAEEAKVLARILLERAAELD